MRWIHSARMSRFLLRRSRYAYCSAFSTLLRAMWMQFFARPLKPCVRDDTCVQGKPFSGAEAVLQHGFMQRCRDGGRTLASLRTLSLCICMVSLLCQIIKSKAQLSSGLSRVRRCPANVPPLSSGLRRRC